MSFPNIRLRLPERLVPALALSIFMALRCANLAAGEMPVSRLQAAFIYNFTQFVEWPNTNAADTLNICALSDGERSVELDAIAGKRAQGWRLVVTHAKNETELDRCQVVVVELSDSQDRIALLRRLATRPVLTIGNSEDFAASGGMIQFFLENNRVRFAVNTDAADRAGLTISSKLLRLARIVRTGETGGR